MRKKVKKHATVQILPPDENGDSVVRIHAEEYQIIDDIDICMEHQAAMELLFSLLINHQVADLRKKLYKH